MKIEVENGAVVLSTSSDWKQLPEVEHNFLHNCYAWGMWLGFTKSGKLQMRVPSKAKYVAELMRIMFVCAKESGVEVAEEVHDVYRAWKEQADSELLLEERLAFLESKRRAWEARERTGCDGCRECERIGDGWFKCKHSGDDLETRFSETWDPVTKSMIIFHEVGIPNAHCKDYYQERKEWR